MAKLILLIGLVMVVLPNFTGKCDGLWLLGMILMAGAALALARLTGGEDR